MGEPLYSIGLTARTLAVAGNVALGDALVYDVSQKAYVLSTSAARASADSKTQGIALQPWGGNGVGDVAYQASGPLSTDVSGLGATTPGLYQLVRVSTAGRLERIASYTPGDDVVGYAFPDGRIAMHLGIPWALIEAAPPGAGLPDKSLQRRGLSGALEGLAHASGSDDGYIEHAADRAGGAATTGDSRFAKGATVRVRSGDGTRDLTALEANGTSTDRLFVGASLSDYGTRVTDFKELWLEARSLIVARLLDVADGGADQGFEVYRELSSTQGTFAILKRTNFAFSGANASVALSQYGGGVGVQFLGDAVTIPSTNPANGLVFYIDPSTHHPMVRIPDGTVYDLTSGSGDQGASTSLAAPPAGDFNLATWPDRITTIDITTAGDTGWSFHGFTAPPAGRSGFLKIVNTTGLNHTLPNNGGIVSANSVICPGGTDLTLVPGKVYGLTYSHADTRWLASEVSP